jgi:hypothetical protein
VWRVWGFLKRELWSISCLAPMSSGAIDAAPVARV